MELPLPIPNREVKRRSADDTHKGKVGNRQRLGAFFVFQIFVYYKSMAFLPWRTKRQFLYFSIFALIILAAIAGLVFYFYPKPTCNDGIKNQNEEGIDCGGPCTPCLGEIEDMSVLWTRFFKNRTNTYDVAALVENSNLYAGIKSVKYQFKLYDANNILIASRDGETFINPGERQLIFESDLETVNRTPKYANFEFDPKKDWKYLKKEKSFLSVIKKDFINSPFPRLSATIRNDFFTEVNSVLVSAVLYDDSGNAFAASATKIDAILPESSLPAFLTWPLPFDKDPATIEVIVLTNLMKN